MTACLSAQAQELCAAHALACYVQSIAVPVHSVSLCLLLLGIDNTKSALACSRHLQAGTAQLALLTLYVRIISSMAPSRMSSVGMWGRKSLPGDVWESNSMLEWACETGGHYLATPGSATAYA